MAIDISIEVIQARGQTVSVAYENIRYLAAEL